MASISVYSQISSNKTQSLLIIGFFVVFIITVSYIVGQATSLGVSLTVFALVLSSLASVGSYFYSNRIILSILNAKEADRKKDFDLYTVAENMAISAGLPKPKVYIIEDNALNAFATGRDPHHAIVCVTSGLVEKLERRELEGVIAHEISHIKNFDIRLMAVVAVLFGTIVYLSDWSLRFLWFRKGSSRTNLKGKSGLVLVLLGILLTIVSPIVATLIQLAVSRQREYLADASAALLTRQPEGLASALRKIAEDELVVQTASNGVAHLFIANPFKKKSASFWFSSLFDTHPPIEERIKILREM